jgi:spore coat polysaccharide biosynthesis protein SpsF
MRADVTAIIQARMGSSRLPGKVLMPLAGLAVIDRVVAQLQYSRRLSGIVVATTTSPSDDPLVEHVRKRNIRFFRGSEDDVLDRYYQCAACIGANNIARITADCPLIDPQVVDATIELFEKSQVMYASNIEPATFPDGLDVEVFSYEALEWSWREAKLPSEREHVTQYIRKHPELFSRVTLESPVPLEQLRWTLDQVEDYNFLSEVFDALPSRDAPVLMEQVLRALRYMPDLQRSNDHIERNLGLKKSLAEDPV